MSLPASLAFLNWLADSLLLMPPEKYNTTQIKRHELLVHIRIDTGKMDDSSERSQYEKATYSMISTM